MALHVDIYRVDHRDGFSMPRITLANRRAAGAPTLHWICQRHLEILLMNRTDGGSSGAIWKALSASGLGSTSLCCAKQAVTDRRRESRARRRRRALVAVAPERRRDAVRLGGYGLLSRGTSAIADSGTSLIIGPKAVVNTLMAALNLQTAPGGDARTTTVASGASGTGAPPRPLRLRGAARRCPPRAATRPMTL